MMVHEQPVSIHNKKSSHTHARSPKDKEKSSSSSKSGSEKASKTKLKKNAFKAPSLPDGSKPNFGNATNPEVKSGHKKSYSNEPSLPDGSRPNFGASKRTSANGKVKSTAPPNSHQSAHGQSNHTHHPHSSSQSNTGGHNNKPSTAETTYAGSSFHSSPSVLNLPKPSLSKTASTSPLMNTKNSTTQQSPNNLYHNHPQPPQIPAMAPFNSMPMEQIPPGYPMSYMTPMSYPWMSMPHMNYAPQGMYYQTQMPVVQPQHQMPLHVPYTSNNLGGNDYQVHNQSHIQGTRISFNDLLDSNKAESKPSQNQILENDLKKMLKLS